MLRQVSAYPAPAPYVGAPPRNAAIPPPNAPPPNAPPPNAAIPPTCSRRRALGAVTHRGCRRRALWAWVRTVSFGDLIRWELDGDRGELLRRGWSASSSCSWARTIGANDGTGPGRAASCRGCGRYEARLELVEGVRQEVDGGLAAGRSTLMVSTRPRDVGSEPDDPAAREALVALSSRSSTAWRRRSGSV